LTNAQLLSRALTGLNQPRISVVIGNEGGLAAGISRLRVMMPRPVTADGSRGRRMLTGHRGMHQHADANASTASSFTAMNPGRVA